MQGRAIEPGLIRKIHPDIVLGERDHLIDPAVYAIFYSPKMGKKDMASRISYIRRVSGMDFRDVVFFLTVSPEEAVGRIERRIAQNRYDPKRPKREKLRQMHEHSIHLARLQSEYSTAFRVIKGLHPIQVFEFDTTNQTKDQVADFVGTNIREIIKRNGINNNVVYERNVA